MRGGPLPIVGHQSGALFDPRIKASGEDEPAGTAAATSTTSFGHEIRVSTCFASPPATSYVSIRRADGRPVDDPKVVAADGELLLIRVPVACAGPRSVDW
nr:unnamed protein product [Digitaria exilis]